MIHHARRFTRFTIVFIIPGLLLVSCKRQEAHTVDYPKILDYFKSNPRFSLLARANSRLGLDTNRYFLGGSAITFFAPNDDGFLRSGISQQYVDTVNVATLRYIIQNHILLSNLGGRNLVSSISFTQPLQTLNASYEPLVTKNSFGIFLNGNKVVSADIPAADGLIQEMDGVAVPPFANLWQTVQVQPDLSITAFVIAQLPFLHDSLNHTNYGQITFFAPSDSAWHAFGYADTNAIKRVSLDTLPHLIGDLLWKNTLPLFTSQFFGGYTFYNVGPRFGTGVVFPYSSTATLDISLDGLHIFQGTGFPSPAIIRSNILATNGVIHIIDLVPQPLY